KTPAAQAVPDTAVVNELSTGLNTFPTQLTEIDSRLQVSSKAPDRVQAEECLADFKTSTEAYLASQDQTAALLNNFDSADSQNAIYNGLQRAIETQRQELQTAAQH